MMERDELRLAREAIRKGLFQSEDLIRAGGGSDPDRIGRYVILGELGRGGMGIVYEAWDPTLNRVVAVKCITAPSSDPEVMLRRFQREALIIARLSHPHIVPIHELGSHGGRPYLVMDCINGVTIDRIRFDAAEAVEVLRQVCDAIQYTHSQGVIHRDLKPANIMRGDEGHAWVMDFGLARSTEHDPAITNTGFALGTPYYMSPEQAEGRPVDERSDVYSLGATLYALLSGKPPFWNLNPKEFLRKVAEETAAPLAVVAPQIDADLDLVVQKCMSKEPERRYAAVRDLAADLDRWRRGEPIQARPPSVSYRLKKALLKRKGVVTAALLGLVGVATVLALIFPRLSQRERDLAAREEQLRLWEEVGTILEEADRYRRLGEIARAAAGIEEGIRICRDRLARHDFALGHYFLGRFLHARAEYDAAERELSRAIEMDPALNEARLERGMVRVALYQSLYGTVEEATENELADQAMRDLSVPLRRSVFVPRTTRSLATAQLALIRGETEEAETQLKRVLEEDPSQSRAMVQLAFLAMSRGGFDEAVEWTTRALDQDRGEREAHYLRSQARLQAVQGDPRAQDRSAKLTSALKDIDRALELGLTHSSAYNHRGLVRYEMGDLEGSIDDFREALARNPRRVWIHGNLARAYEALGRADPENASSLHDQAIRICSEGLEIQPNLLALYIPRGNARLARGDREGAIDDFTRAAEDERVRATAYFNLGSVHYRMGDPDRAEGFFSRALDLQPKNPRAYVGRALARQARGEWELAIRDCAEAIKLDPRLPDPYATRANVRKAKADALGKTEEARAERNRGLEDYDAFLNLEPDSALGHHNRGALYHALGMVPEALRDYDRALELDPRYRDAYRNRARLHFEAGASEKARDDYSALIRLDPRDEEAFLSRSVVREKLGDRAGAIEDLGRAIEINSKNATALYTRGNLYHRRNEYEAAVRDYTGALEIEPKHVWACYYRGIARWKLGRRTEAVEDFQKASEWAPVEWTERSKVESWLKTLRGSPSPIPDRVDGSSPPPSNRPAPDLPGAGP